MRRRLTVQVQNAAHYYGGGGYSKLHLENIELMYVILRSVLRAMGMLHHGTRNCLEYQVVQREEHLRRLPGDFDGFRILQLSDMHFDAVPDGGARLYETVSQLEFDLCVLTGDYRFLTHDIYKPCLEGLRRLRPVLDCAHGVFAILGNHDFLEMVPGLEHMGIRVLLNESEIIAINGSNLCLAGVDDPHFYGTADLDRALGSNGGACTVLLCHSPEYYAEAEAARVDYMLCGHTHGGQICLPGGFPVITNAPCPRRYVSGPWSHNAMQGYTSRGTGASGLVVRFNCRPEITIHTLRSQADSHGAMC